MAIMATISTEAFDFIESGARCFVLANHNVYQKGDNVCFSREGNFSRKMHVTITNVISGYGLKNGFVAIEFEVFVNRLAGEK